IMNEVVQKGKLAKAASYALSGVTTEDKNNALLQIAKQMVADQDAIITENKKDLENGKQAGLDSSMLDRLMLNEERIEAMAHGIELLVDLKDPINEVL